MIASDICEIIAVRHGQTVANKTGVLQGQSDTPLDEVGLLQAQAIATRLQKRHFDIAYSSDLSRAMVTAQTIAEFHSGLQIIPSPALREWNLGELQGQSYNDLIIKYPEIMNAFKHEGDIPHVAGIETIFEFHLRVSSCLDKIAAENLGKRVLLVSHGGAMQRMLAYTMGKLASDNIRPLCDNASLSLFKYKSGHWQLVTWNDTAHLENIGIHNTLTF